VTGISIPFALQVLLHGYLYRRLPISSPLYVLYVRRKCTNSYLLLLLLLLLRSIIHVEVVDLFPQPHIFHFAASSHH